MDDPFQLEEPMTNEELKVLRANFYRVLMFCSVVSTACFVASILAFASRMK